jgi:hypothetical protein
MKPSAYCDLFDPRASPSQQTPSFRMDDEKETELRKVGSPPAALTPSASPSDVTKIFITRVYIILRSPATSAKQRGRFLRKGSYPMERRYGISSGVLPTLSTRYCAAPSRPSRRRQVLSAASASFKIMASAVLLETSLGAHRAVADGRERAFALPFAIRCVVLFSWSSRRSRP